MLALIWIFQALLLVSVNNALDGWESLGCWRDLPFRAIASLEGRSKLLSKNWKNRTSPLKSCADVANANNYQVFAIQDGGQCFGGPYAQYFFDQYGPSNLCRGGVGGTWSSDVYSSKTAYQRVLKEESADQKPVKCSKPLDLVFLVDGAGDKSLENKLRWSEMLKFISKTTEEFDPDTTRFGVVRYGAEPKVIINMTSDRDVLTMRDTLMTEKYPGGKRTINEAMKEAWKEMLKPDKRIANKVIVSLTAGNMNYGPWGSTLFLTNKNVRVMAFGIDKEPSYRYLESMASWKRPENIYSLDSDQLLKSVPFVTKDICTGSKKEQVETVKKDKEIELFESNEFETVGSAVERQLERKGGHESRGPKEEFSSRRKFEHYNYFGKAERKSVDGKKGENVVSNAEEIANSDKADNSDVENSKDSHADEKESEIGSGKKAGVSTIPDINTYMYTGKAIARDNKEKADRTGRNPTSKLNTSSSSTQSATKPMSYTTDDNDEFRASDDVKSGAKNNAKETGDEGGSGFDVAGENLKSEATVHHKSKAFQKRGPTSKQYFPNAEERAVPQSKKSQESQERNSTAHASASHDGKAASNSTTDEEHKTPTAVNASTESTKPLVSNSAYTGSTNTTPSIANEQDKRPTAGTGRSNPTSYSGNSESKKPSTNAVGTETAKPASMAAANSEGTKPSSNAVSAENTKAMSYSANADSKMPASNRASTQSSNLTSSAAGSEDKKPPTNTVSTENAKPASTEANKSQGYTENAKPASYPANVDNKMQASNIASTQNTSPTTSTAKSDSSKPSTNTAGTENAKPVSYTANSERKAPASYTAATETAKSASFPANADNKKPGTYTASSGIAKPTANTTSEKDTKTWSAPNAVGSTGKQDSGAVDDLKSVATASQANNRAVNENILKNNYLQPAKFPYKGSNLNNKDLDHEVFSSIQKERDSFSDDDDDSVFSSDKDRKYDNSSNDDKIADDASELVSDDPYDPVSTDTDAMTQRALEQKKKEIDILLKKLDENRRRKHRKRKRRKIRFSKLYEAKNLMLDDSLDGDSDLKSEGRELVKEGRDAAIREGEEHRSSQGEIIAAYQDRQKTSTKTLPTRHYIRVSQNDSKPLPVKRPVAPTIHVITVMQKLYNATPVGNAKLNYDIFDPVYMSNESSNLAGKSVPGYKQQSNSSDVNAMNLKRLYNDEQNYFLRHSINNKNIFAESRQNNRNFQPELNRQQPKVAGYTPETKYFPQDSKTSQSNDANTLKSISSPTPSYSSLPKSNNYNSFQYNAQNTNQYGSGYKPDEGNFKQEKTMPQVKTVTKVDYTDKEKYEQKTESNFYQQDFKPDTKAYKPEMTNAQLSPDTQAKTAQAFSYNPNYDSRNLNAIGQNINRFNPQMMAYKPEVTNAVRPTETMAKTVNSIPYSGNYVNQPVQYDSRFKPVVAAFKPKVTTLGKPSNYMKQYSTLGYNTNSKQLPKINKTATKLGKFILQKLRREDLHNFTNWIVAPFQKLKNEAEEVNQNLDSDFHPLTNFAPKEEQPTTRTVHNQTKISNPSSPKFSKFKFLPLPDIDSGSYKIQKVSNNKILVTLRSKDGELQTFYGSSDEENKPKVTKVQNVIKDKPLKRVAPIQRTPSKKSLDRNVHGLMNAQKNVEIRPLSSPKMSNVSHLIRPNEASNKQLHPDKTKQTAFDIYDNRLALVDKPIAFSVVPHSDDRLTGNKALRRRKPISASRKSLPVTKHLTRNSKQTAIDLYDNRLATVDKPVSYFIKPHKIDRLIITENDDPNTDASMIKLFLNSGTDDSLPSETIGPKMDPQLHLRHIVEQDYPAHDRSIGKSKSRHRGSSKRGHAKSSGISSSGDEPAEESSEFDRNPDSKAYDLDDVKSFEKSSSDSTLNNEFEKAGQNTADSENGASSVSKNGGKSLGKEAKTGDKEDKSSESAKSSKKESKETSSAKASQEREKVSGKKKQAESAKTSAIEKESPENREKATGKADKASEKGEQAGKEIKASAGEDKSKERAEKSSEKEKKALQGGEKSTGKEEKEYSSGGKEFKNGEKESQSGKKGEENKSTKGENASQFTNASSGEHDKTKDISSKTATKDTKDKSSNFKEEKYSESPEKEKSKNNGLSEGKSKEKEASEGSDRRNNDEKSKDSKSESSSEESKTEEAVVSQLEKDVIGCNRPMKVLYAIDVSEGIGTGPARKKRWDHLKRFLHTVNDKITQGGNMGYVVYDSEPRFVSQLEPCDEKTEYFVTSGECLCDKRAKSYKAGQSSCTTHAPTPDESLEDWGAQGPRTAKALQMARQYFKDDVFKDSKKLIVLLTHQASTDDVTSVEKELKNDSISLVDIEIGERHNIRKRSSNFDEVIPRDHQMEVSFHKLDHAIEKIVRKICTEKNPSKVRRSRIYASFKHSKPRWK